MHFDWYELIKLDSLEYKKMAYIATTVADAIKWIEKWKAQITWREREKKIQSISFWIAWIPCDKRVKKKLMEIRFTWFDWEINQ